MIVVTREDIPAELMDYFEPVSATERTDVWEIATHGFPGAHFAVWPPELVAPMIRAGCPERVCSRCGTPWGRIKTSAVAAVPHAKDSTTRVRAGRSHRHAFALSQPQIAAILQNAAAGREADCQARYGSKWARWVQTDTSGAQGPTGADWADLQAFLDIPMTIDWPATPAWGPRCTCGADPTPGTVLDPFAGSGTSLQVANQMGRHAVGIELNPDYAPMIAERAGQPGFVWADAETS